MMTISNFLSDIKVTVEGKQISSVRWRAECEADSLLQKIFDGNVP